MPLPDPDPLLDDASERYARQHALLEVARCLGAAQRDAFLARECGDDPALRAEVVGLLDALDDDGTGLSDALIARVRAGLEQIVDDARRAP